MTPEQTAAMDQARDMVENIFHSALGTDNDCIIAIARAILTAKAAQARECEDVAEGIAKSVITSQIGFGAARLIAVRLRARADALEQQAKELEL